MSQGSTDAQGLAETRDECWPDWVSPSGVIVDDVSRLNATRVKRVYHVRSLDDIVRLVTAAKEKKLSISTRGTKHSMGGHTMHEGAIVLDMEFINHLKLQEDGTVIAGTGAHWSDLIQYLNHFGKAPRTLQSYCSFSIGGTISVNGHGITTDFCLAESIVSFQLVTADGRVIECSRDAESEEARELFRCCIGGYGLFGVIFEVRLKTNDNVRLFMDTMTVPLNDLPILYQGIASANDVEVKLARINITTFDVGEIYLFRKHCATPTVSNLRMKPQEMSNASRLMYKWFAGPLREVRFALEQQLGVALDWSEVIDRNLLLYESAQPLAKLYSPLLLVDDTFILQEYFVPKDNYNSWIAGAKQIVLEQIHQEKLLTLLNITIRVVEQDVDSILRYSSQPQGSFAFVFYYRLRRTCEAIQLLATYHDKLASLTLTEGGTFYLPYQHHYSHTQLNTAYPSFAKFCKLKQHYDPEERFSNLWWQHYGCAKPPVHTMSFMSPKSAKPVTIAAPEPTSPPEKKIKDKKKTKSKTGTSPAAPSSDSSAPSSPSPSETAVTETKPVDPTPPPVDVLESITPKVLGEAELDKLFTGVSIHRTDSFRKLMADSLQRTQFLEVFLTEVLAIGNNTQLFRQLNRAIYDPRLKDDDQIYMSLKEGVDSNVGPITQIVKAWQNVKQLSTQKKELTREIVSVLTRSGKAGKVHTMCSIGDHGKLVLRLRQALNMKGHVWIVHDKQGDESDIGAILERGAMQADVIGEFVPINYEHVRKDGREFAAIPDEVVDLVTMNQGLHHLVPDQLKDFLAAVHRILRPGGTFIIREHDLDEEKKLMPMLDCAHMVFNVLTGVAPKEERSEIRGFRTILEWRLLLESCGFRDTMVYEMQPDDPTKDIMMCFTKFSSSQAAESPQRPRYSPALHLSHSVRTIAEGKITESKQMMNIPPSISTFGPTVALNQLPRVGLTTLKSLLQTAQKLLPDLQQALVTAATTLIPKDIPGLSEAVKLVINNYVAPALMMLARFEPLTDAATPHPNIAENFIPEELFLVLQVLRVRAKQGGVFELAIVSIIDKFMGKLNKDRSRDKNGSRSEEAASPSAIAEASNMSYDEVRAEMVLLLQCYPELQELHKVVKGLGLSSSASNLLCSFLPEAGSADDYTRWAIAKLEKESWARLKNALADARQSRRLPTMATIKQPNAPWNRVVTAIMSTPRITISGTHSFVASAVGLGDFMELYNSVKASQRSSKPPPKPSTILPAPIQGKLDTLCPTEKYEGTGVLHNVLHVVSARFIKKSLTGLFKQNEQDVTHAARLVLQSDGTLDTADIDIDKSLLLGGVSYIIEYKALPDLTGKTRKAGTQIAQLLASSGHLNGQLHEGHSNFTWYKLSEWMQVEITQLFGNSMSHTPWYRFPFVDIMRIYFEVLFKEVGIVSERVGAMNALTDQGFIVDAIPGVVMGLLFGQMQLMALPLKMLLGQSYDTSKLVEQLLVMVPGKVSWAHIDKRIVPLAEFEQGLCIIQVPTFKPMTEVLRNIALNVPKAIILQISNNALVQVKVQLDDASQKDMALRHFSAAAGVTVNFDYRFPAIGNPENGAVEEHSNPPVFISLTVQVPALLEFIRKVDSWSYCSIFQIYDFF